jgi:hypothetical protein
MKAVAPGPDPEGREAGRARAGTIAPWALAQMLYARCTTRWGAVREWTKRAMAPASCSVNGRTLHAIDFTPMDGWREHNMIEERNHLARLLPF